MKIARVFPRKTNMTLDFYQDNGILTSTSGRRIYYVQNGLLVGAGRLTASLMSTERSPVFLGGNMKHTYVCPCCKKEKSILDFYKDHTTATGRMVYCKECAVDKSKKYQHSKRGKYITNLRHRLRRILNPEKIRKGYKLLRRTYNKTFAGKYWNTKSQAKRSGKEFDIKQEDFVAWMTNQPLECHYCGQELLFGNGTHGNHMNTLTIDRKDNQRGYFLDNIALACRQCNTIKGGWFTEDQMLEIAHKYLRKEVL